MRWFGELTSSYPNYDEGVDMPLPLTKNVVLIGGGHAHALVMKSWAMDPTAGARVTVINPDPTAPYTGMLPGFVAGHYTRPVSYTHLTLPTNREV